MATRYINSDSDGSADNPTRAFDDPSYTPNDSYATLSAAYTAASAGDILEFSGGASGKTYVGHNDNITKALTFRGSSISGHSSTVTITRSPVNLCAIGAVADGIVIQDMTLSGVDLGEVLMIAKDTTVNNVILTNTGAISNALRLADGFTQTVTINQMSILAPAGVNFVSINMLGGAIVTINNSYIEGTEAAGATLSNIITQSTGAITVNYSIIKGGYRTLYLVGPATFNNCVFIPYLPSKYIDLGAITATFNNCTILTSLYGISYPAGSTLNTNNCLIQGLYIQPNLFTLASGGTWNSSNDIINGFPYFTKTEENIGYISISTDDKANIAYFKTLADYAMSTYGISMSMFVAETNTLSAGDKTNLQAVYKTGHDIATHTRHHRDLQYSVNALKVTYSGAQADIAFVVSASGTTLNVTGSGDTHLGIDLTAAATDTLGELSAVIDAWENYACELVDEFAVDIPSIALKDASTALPQTVQTNIPYDDAADATNRLFTSEITNSISDLETAIQEDPECAAYTVKMMSWPFSTSTSAAVAWVRNNANLIGARNSTGVWTTAQYFEPANLGSMNVYAASHVLAGEHLKGADYAGLSEAQKKVRIEQAARAFATRASRGQYLGFLFHTVADVTLTEFQWFLDELVKYRTPYNIKIGSYAEIINEITTSGDWTDAGGGVWTRAFTGSDDYHPLNLSSLIDAGTDVGLTSDYEGNSVPFGSAPDIGAYEYYFYPPHHIYKISSSSGSRTGSGNVGPFVIYDTKKLER